MRLTFAQIQKIWEETIEGDVVEITEEDVDIRKIVINDNDEISMVLDRNGEELCE